jgi:hypothetical protein
VPLDEASLEHTHGRGHGTMSVVGIQSAGRASGVYGTRSHGYIYGFRLFGLIGLSSSVI